METEIYDRALKLEMNYVDSYNIGDHFRIFQVLYCNETNKFD